MSYSHIIFVFSSVALATVVLAGPGGGGRHGGPGGRHGGPPPPFLRNVTEEGRRAFFNITMNQNLTLNQIDSQTAQWAQTYGVADQYQQFEANMTAHRDEIQRNVTSVINNLSAAQNALEAVFNNKDQTRQQQRDAIDQLKTQYPQEIPALFFISGQSRKGGRGGPGGRGGQGGQGARNGPGFGGQNRFLGGRNNQNQNNNGFGNGDNSEDNDNFGGDF